MEYLYALAAEDGSDWLASFESASSGWLPDTRGGFTVSSFWFPDSRLWLHRLDHYRAPVDGFQQVAGGSYSFCLIVAGGIALSCDTQDAVPFISVHDLQALDSGIPGRVECARQAKNRRQS